MYGGSNQSYFQSKYRWKQFKRGRDSTHDYLKFGRSLEAQTKEIINKIKNFLLTDHIDLKF